MFSLRFAVRQLRVRTTLCRQLHGRSQRHGDETRSWSRQSSQQLNRRL